MQVRKEFTVKPGETLELGDDGCQATHGVTTVNPKTPRPSGEGARRRVRGTRKPLPFPLPLRRPSRRKRTKAWPGEQARLRRAPPHPIALPVGASATGLHLRSSML